MNISDVVSLRLHNQLLTQSIFNSPEEVVSWFGAIQSQDYTSAKWAIGLRSKNLDDSQIEQAFNQGKILRTHIMRPTWHFVTPKDIQWMLSLTKDRVHKMNGSFYRVLGLDTAIFQKCLNVIQKLLQNNNYLTREAIGREINKTCNFSKNTNLIVGCILMHAELEGVICSGPRKGKQFTYALLSDRVTTGNTLSFEESLTELTLRYFQSHGPAALQDFAWWSGLTISDARRGIELNKSKLKQEKIKDTLYWFTEFKPVPKLDQKIYLLPNYDEYIVAYKNRELIFDSRHTLKLDSRANPLFQHTIILDGKVIGTWKREFKKNAVEVNTNIFESLSETEKKLLEQSVTQFGKFLDRTGDNSQLPSDTLTSRI